MWAAVIWMFDWAGGFTSKMAQSHSWPLSAGRWLLSIETSPHGCSSVPTIWQLTFPRTSNLREQGRSHDTFCDLALEVTPYTSATIYCSYESCLFHRERRLYETMTTTRTTEGHRGNFMEIKFCEVQALGRRHVGIDALMALKLVEFWGNLPMLLFELWKSPHLSQIA